MDNNCNVTNVRIQVYKAQSVSTDWTVRLVGKLTAEFLFWHLDEKEKKKLLTLLTKLTSVAHVAQMNSMVVRRLAGENNLMVAVGDPIEDKWIPLFVENPKICDLNEVRELMRSDPQKVSEYHERLYGDD